MTITISDKDKADVFYNVPLKVAKAIITLLKECECESEIISAEEERSE